MHNPVRGKETACSLCIWEEAFNFLHNHSHQHLPVCVNRFYQQPNRATHWSLSHTCKSYLLSLAFKHKMELFTYACDTQLLTHNCQHIPVCWGWAYQAAARWHPRSQTDRCCSLTRRFLIGLLGLPAHDWLQHNTWHSDTVLATSLRQRNSPLTVFLPASTQKVKAGFIFALVLFIFFAVRSGT